jgi:hypothetical protein
VLVTPAIAFNSTGLRLLVPQMFAENAAQGVYERANPHNHDHDDNDQDHQADKAAIDEHQVLHDRGPGIAPA